MADEENESEGKKKFSLKKIILLVVVLLVLTGGGGAAMYFMGFIGGGASEKSEAAPEQALQKAEQQAAQQASASASTPATPLPMTKVARQSPELTRFEQSYLELERDFVVNLTNSRKVMQVKIALMTHYDKRVLDNVKKHEFALRSVTLDVMRQANDVDLAKPTFRVEMAEKIRTEINTVLEKYEDFGGIEAVYFTHFVVQ
jgi:flagellar FliL protein